MLRRPTNRERARELQREYAARQRAGIGLYPVPLLALEVAALIPFGWLKKGEEHGRTIPFPDIPLMRPGISTNIEFTGLCSATAPADPRSGRRDCGRWASGAPAARHISSARRNISGIAAEGDQRQQRVAIVRMARELSLSTVIASLAAAG